MQYSEEEKTMWVEDWRQSGKTAWAYAKANGLNQRTFVKRTKTAVEEKPCFVEVPMPVMSGRQCEPEIMIEKGEVKIHIPLIDERSEVAVVLTRT